MWLLYPLILSLFCLVVLLFSKINEIKIGQRTFVGRLISKGDPFIAILSQRVQIFLSHHGERTVFLFLVHIPSKIEVFFRKFRTRAHDYYHGVNNKMRGRKNFPTSHVSPYMRSMTFRRDSDSGRV